MARYWRVVGPQRLAPAVIVVTCCLISACGAGAAKDAVDLLTAKYTVGGSVSGLSGSGLVLQDNGADSLAISANGSFTLATTLAVGASYAVTVKTQPANPAQICTVSEGTGTIGTANVTSVAVSCTTATFTVGGTLSGLTGSGLILEDNGGDDLPVSANGTFTFAAAVANGGAYTVTVKTQPSNPAQTCSVAHGSGTIAGASVTNVAVNCRAGGTLTPDEAVLTDIQTQWAAIVQQGGSFSTPMAQYLKSRPELTSVSVESDGSVAAQFADGRLLIVAHNRALARNPASSIHATNAPGRASIEPAAERAAAVIAMPSKKKAIITQGFGLGYDNTEALTDELAQWLTTAGYEATAFQAVEPATLRTAIQNVDIFVHTGHGGLGHDKINPQDTIFAVSTAIVSSKYSPAFPAETVDDSADFASQRLVYMIDDVSTDAATGQPIPGTFWAITGAFVEHYMSFNPGSLIVINTCNSASHALKVLTQAFPGSFKTAGTYLGWDGTASDLGNDRIRYVFDRLLGELPGGGGRASIAQESPAQRAFNLAAVLGDMTAQGLIPLGAPGTANGNLVSLGPNDAILAPSIAFLSSTDYTGQLGVAGIFDPAQKANASITVGGKDCPIQDWSAQYATCTLPQYGAGSEGDVVVTVNDIHSNSVSLTSWRGTFTYKITGESNLQSTLLLDLHWRADIHTWRAGPHAKPEHYDFLQDLAQDSTANWSASGSQTVPGMPPGTVTISGGGSLPWGSPSSAGSGEFYTGYEIIDPETQTQWMYLGALARKQIAVSGNTCTGPDDFITMIFGSSPQSVLFYMTPPPYGTQQISAIALPLPMDAKFALLAGEQSGQLGSGCPYGLLGSPTTWKLSWPQIAPTSPPDPTQAQ